ncbi:hypothetical protein [Serratia sp. TKO39]|uniref:hypothetical protein n=1 Tax=Serratia sp. TKO39 TaxID=2052589 RepID=UPI000C2422AB|nr:hypothetical protein [Serratia sp. TKO39]PJI67021.1 hypothetical protein CUN64_17570 [Serratia sp. TKO39]
MELSIITLMKGIIGGAGAGVATVGGLSMLIPAFTVTAGIAYLSATIGAVLVGTLAAKGRIA